MTTPDDHIERLISRKLDGALSDDDALELDKCLIRDPEARRSLDESRRIDGLTATYLDEIAALGDDVSCLPLPPRRARGRSWWFAVVPAVAAACLMLLLARPMFSHREPQGELVAQTDSETRVPNDSQTDVIAASDTSSAVRPRFADNPRSRGNLIPLRELGTRVNYYGVLDEGTNNLYLLQVTQETTAQRRSRLDQRRSSQGGVRLASSEM